MGSQSTDFKAIVDHFQKGVFQCTASPSSKFLYFNDRFCKTLGVPQTKMKTKKVKEIFADKKRFNIFCEKLKNEGRVESFEVPVVGKNKKITVCSFSAVCTDNGKASNKIFNVVVDDISVRKKIEKGLLDSRRLFETVFNNTAAAITVTDKDEKIVAWNPYAERMFFIPKEELFNKPVKELYPPNEWKKIRALQIRKKGMLSNVETKVMRSDRTLLDADLSVTVLKDSENKIVGSIGIIRDITEQKKAQELLLQAKLAAEQANKAKSLFLANMSHEVRTPMNSIMGMIDLTIDTELNDEQKENLLVAKDAAVNLLSLLNDILDLSRVEAGKIILEKIDFHLPNVCHSVIKGLSVIAGDKGLELVLKIEKDVPEGLIGDPIRLRQVLINLINNAIKFTTTGKIIMHIKVAKGKQKKDSVTLEFAVIDKGVGIPKARQKQIFRTFTQADSSTTRKFGGTGLGLAICKKLTSLMGGKIWVESDEGKGSTFSFTATFKVVKGKKLKNLTVDKTEPSVEAGKVQERSLSNLRILLAEDNVVNQRIAGRMLEKAGGQVFMAEDGKQVLEMVESKDIDIVLMDANMPILDGIEATKIIRSIEKRTETYLPIIALTARAMQEDKREFLSVGMDGCVTKPIDRQSLIREILNCVKKGKKNG